MIKMTKNEEAIRMIFKAKCVICNEPMDQIHHINGNHDDDALSNIATLCPKCHARAQIALTLSKLGKHAKTLNELIENENFNSKAKQILQEIKEELIKDKKSAEMVKSFTVEVICKNMLLKAQKYYQENSPSTKDSFENQEVSNSLDNFTKERTEMLRKCETLITECRGGSLSDQ